MATMIKISSADGKAQPIFVNSNENNDLINHLFGFFQTNPVKTDFYLPKEAENYQLFINQEDHFSNNFKPTNNPISLSDSQSMAVIKVKPESLFFQGLVVEEIFVGHKSMAEIAAFQSIWESIHLC